MRIFFIITSYKFLFMGDLHATRTTGVAKTWLYQCSRVSNDLWLLFFPLSCEMLFFGRVPRWLMKPNQFTFIEKNEQSTIFKEKFFKKLFFCLAYCSENVLYYCMCIVMYDLWPWSTDSDVYHTIPVFFHLFFLSLYIVCCLPHIVN